MIDLSCRFPGWPNPSPKRKRHRHLLLNAASSGMPETAISTSASSSTRTTQEMAEAQRLNERLVHRALALDGTCTGEHGIGCGKLDFLLAEHGEAVSVMRAIKLTIVPGNIMNPGKIFRV